MGVTVNPGYHYCAKAERNVSLGQTEWQCRERHNCGDGPCPLEAKLTPARFPNAFALLTPFLRDSAANKK